MKSLTTKALFLFSVPSILSSVLEPLASVVDTALVGKLDTKSLGALAICTIIFNSFSWMFNFLVHTSTQAVSASIDGDRNVYCQKIKISLSLALIVGLIASTFLYFSRGWLYQLAGSSIELLPLIEAYFIIRVFGHVFTILYMTTLSILRGQRKVKLSFWIVMVTTLSNIVISYWLLYVENMGVEGAAIGTVASNILGFLICFGFLFSKVSFFKEVLLSKSTESSWLRFGKNSWDMFGRSLFLTTAFFLSTRFSAKIGTEQLAAHQILLQIWLFISFFIDGIAVTGNILGAKFFTEKNANDLKNMSSVLLKLGVWIGVGFTVVLLAFYNVIPYLFTDDIKIVEQVQKLWFLIVLSQIPNALAFVYDGLLFGHGSFAYLRLHIFIAVFFFFLPISVYGLYQNDILWIWWGFVLLNCYRIFSGHRKTMSNIRGLM